MSILILFGSETGTAQDIAESLRRESEMRHLPAEVQELDDFDMNNIHDHPIVIFVVSTTGQGEMPPNMRKFWKFLLRKSIPTDFLRKIKTSVIGLGDSTYQKFNFAGKKLYRRLIQIGAEMMTNLCLADDRHELGIDGAFIPWKSEFWRRLFEFRIFPEMTLNIDPQVVIKPKFRFEDVEIGGNSKKSEIIDFFELQVESNIRVTSQNHFQDTRLIRLRIGEKEQEFFGYQPGDVLMVKPYNPKETVEIAIKALGFSEEELDKPRKIVGNSSKSSPPNYLLGNPTTLRTCLSRYFDLQQVPKKSFFEMLSYYSTDPTEKERLAELASPEGLDDLLDYANRSRRTCAETLRDFSETSKNLKPDELFEIFTVIRPRAFSIASSPSPFHIEILVAKVEYSSRMAEKRKGLCSTFLSRLKENDTIFGKIRPGTFKFPSNDKPVICVGPGTGIAPFRSFFGARNLESQPVSLLFFGCRSKFHDFYFEKEWPVLRGVEVVTAFSRDSEKKIYVQHKMGEYAPRIRKLLDQDAQVFIAGSSGDMPKAVSDVLKQIKGEEWTAKAEASGRIQYETWS